MVQRIVPAGRLIRALPARRDKRVGHLPYGLSTKTGAEDGPARCAGVWLAAPALGLLRWRLGLGLSPPKLSWVGDKTRLKPKAQYLHHQAGRSTIGCGRNCL